MFQSLAWFYVSVNYIIVCWSQRVHTIWPVYGVALESVLLLVLLLWWKRMMMVSTEAAEYAGWSIYAMNITCWLHYISRSAWWPHLMKLHLRWVMFSGHIEWMIKLISMCDISIYCSCWKLLHIHADPHLLTYSCLMEFAVKTTLLMR